MLRINYFILLSLNFLLACSGNQTKEQQSSNEKENQRLELYGNTQGTTFSIICNDPIKLTQEEIEQTLANFDLALSAYIPNSIISKLNNAPAGTFTYSDSFNYFNRCFLLSKQMWQTSNMTFDPTVYPLVDGWGFMKDMENVPDSATVQSLLSLVGFADGKHFSFITHKDSLGNIVADSKIIKHTPNAKLDFNGNCSFKEQKYCNIRFI